MPEPWTGARVVEGCEHTPAGCHTCDPYSMLTLGACAACIEAALAEWRDAAVNTPTSQFYADHWKREHYAITLAHEALRQDIARIERNLLLTAECDTLAQALDVERAAGRAVVQACVAAIEEWYAQDHDGVLPREQAVNAAHREVAALRRADAYLAERPAGEAGTKPRSETPLDTLRRMNAERATPPRPGREEILTAVRKVVRIEYGEPTDLVRLFEYGEPTDLERLFEVADLVVDTVLAALEGKDG